MLCLDEAFSALDVLTAETLRHEIIALWQKQVANLKSIFMVTHNIEEAVEMATRICILFPRPGRLGLVLENKLPYPRDAKSPEFQRLVAPFTRPSPLLPFPISRQSRLPSPASLFPAPAGAWSPSSRHGRSNYWIDLHPLRRAGTGKYLQHFRRDRKRFWRDHSHCQSRGNLGASGYAKERGSINCPWTPFS